MSNIDFALFHTIYLSWLLLEHTCVSSLLVSANVAAMVLYIPVGWRYQNMDEVLLGYGHVCLGAFKYQHHLAKLT